MGTSDGVLVMIMVGGAGERLQPLTRGRFHLEENFASSILH